jgi:hypothetical protein
MRKYTSQMERRLAFEERAAHAKSREPWGDVAMSVQKKGEWET